MIAAPWFNVNMMAYGRSALTTNRRPGRPIPVRMVRLLHGAECLSAARKRRTLEISGDGAGRPALPRSLPRPRG
jgi:hypothetical protein